MTVLGEERLLDVWDKVEAAVKKKDPVKTIAILKEFSKEVRTLGEMAELLINGFLCSLCGCNLDFEEPGYPRVCCDCAKDHPSDVEGAEIVHVDNVSKNPGRPDLRGSPTKCSNCGFSIKGAIKVSKNTHPDPGGDEIPVTS